MNLLDLFSRLEGFEALGSSARQEGYSETGDQTFYPLVSLSRRAYFFTVPRLRSAGFGLSTDFADR